MNRQIIPLLFAGSLLAVQASPADLRYESKTLGLRFQIPPTFVTGRPAELPGTKEMVEEMAKRGMKYDPDQEESLIERRWAAGQDLKALRRDVPQITLKRQRGSDAEFSRKLAMKDQFRQKIGPWEAYVLPGHPIPYGDHLFYSMIPLKDGSVLEIFAHKTDLKGQPTHYDEVIRKLIESLEMVERPG
jgi:hypothetical protein